jgi:hypothetical protein
VEVSRKIQDSLAGAESLKELLVRLRPLTSPDFHAALMEALAAAEAETGGSVSLDGASAGYKKFAEKVKKLAQEHKLPWQTLVSYKTKMATADEVRERAVHVLATHVLALPFTPALIKYIEEVREAC